MKAKRYKQEQEILAKTLELKWQLTKIDYLIVVLTALCVFFPAFLELLSIIIENNALKNVTIITYAVLASLLVVLAVVKLMTIKREKKKIRLGQYYERRWQLASSVFSAIQDLNGDKVRLIFRHTYGCVSEWEPINYHNNILVYDVHEQIRSILVRIKELIVHSDPNVFNNDNVRVDLVYCYPDITENDNTMDGSSAVNGDEPDGAGDKEGKCYKCLASQIGGRNGSSKDKIKIGDDPHAIYGKWKVITSRDSSGAIHSMHDLIGNSKSFYRYVFDHGYAFMNDKGDENNPIYYLKEKKDIEYMNNEDGKSHGSISGVLIEVRNDDPETTLVSAILTISTYGSTLYDSNRDETITQKEYEHIFKEIVIDNFRSVIATELSQMYIRHALREGVICPITGVTINNINKNSIPHSIASCNPRECDPLKKMLSHNIGIK